MKLQIGANIGENLVRLDFKSSPYKPYNTPSYAIKKSQADEFIKKYNKQEEMLKRLSAAVILSVSGIMGYFTNKNLPVNVKKGKILPVTAAISAGALIGLILSSVIACGLKNDLMNKYEVYQYPKK